MNSRALVLGGGGVTGVAWEIGLLAGLAEGGISFDDATRIVGTSAGSIVAVHVAAGADLSQSLANQLSPPGEEKRGKLGWGLLIRLLWSAWRSASPTEFGVRMGRVATGTATLSEDARRRVFASRLPTQDWPQRPLRITAVDVETGEPAIFDRDSGVSLIDAVAASCAVPGVWPPVTIKGRRYMDGGMRSATNAHLAAGQSRVLIVAPISRGLGPMQSVESHAAELTRGGSQVVVVTPNAAARQAIGRDVLDPARRASAARAGHAQAAEVLETVRAGWPQ